jgi:hypothetical protein
LLFSFLSFAVFFCSSFSPSSPSLAAAPPLYLLPNSPFLLLLSSFSPLFFSVLFFLLFYVSRGRVYIVYTQLLLGKIQCINLGCKSQLICRQIIQMRKLQYSHWFCADSSDFFPTSTHHSSHLC